MEFISRLFALESGFSSVAKRFALQLKMTVELQS